MKKREEYIVIYVTFPRMKTAREITTHLVETKLIACASIFKLFSIYRWEGKIEKNPEYGAFLKTKKSKYRAVEGYIKKHHPYQVPEIITWDIDKGTKDYLKWIDSATD